MNILLYCNTFLPLIGGREIVVHYLAKNLQTLGHRVRISGPSGWWRNRKLKFEYPVHHWPTLRGFMFEEVMMARLLLDCAFWKTDIIHAHNTFPCGYIAAKVSAINKIPLMITPHGMDIHVIPELNFGDRLDPEKRKKIDHALDKAVLTTAISANIQKSLNEAGVSDDKIRRIPNGIDLDRFQKRNDLDIRKHYHLSGDAKIILAVGNYHKRKGLEFLIDAMPAVLDRDKKVCLIVVGRSSESLKEKVEALNLRDSVILTGPVKFPALVNERGGAEENDLLAAIYTQSDVYVSAAVNEGAEGLSLALLDATAAGLPIVATHISGNKDIVEDGGNGFLIDVKCSTAIANAVLKILESSEMKLLMGQRSREIASRYSWQNMARQYIHSYAEAIEQNNLLL